MTTYADLPQPTPAGGILFCPACGETYSATRGDYFWAEPDETIVCHADRSGDGDECMGELQLGRIVTKFEPLDDFVTES